MIPMLLFSFFYGTASSNPVGLTAQLDVHQYNVGQQPIGNLDSGLTVRHRIDYFQIGYGPQGYLEHIPKETFIFNN